MPRWSWLLLAAFCLSGFSGSVGWWLSNQEAAQTQSAVQAEVGGQLEMVQQQLAALSNENTELQLRLVAVERSAQVDQATQDAMRVRCSLLQDKLGQLEDEAAFYQSLLGNDDTAASMHASELQVRMRLSPQYFKYRLTLARFSTAVDTAEGIARLSLVGRQEGKPVTLPWNQINDQGQADFKFSIKQMEVLEGDVHLPEGFIPARLKIELIPLNKAFTRQVEHLDWVVEQSGL
jgi:hypothetical protein